MIFDATNIAIPEPCDRITSVEANASDRSSGAANIPTAINPVSPAHDSRGRAVVVRSLSVNPLPQI